MMGIKEMEGPFWEGEDRLRQNHEIMKGLDMDSEHAISRIGSSGEASSNLLYPIAAERCYRT